MRIGKFIELNLRTDRRDEAERMTKEICSKLLANPVMEDFTFTLEEKKGT